jgi:hypothetical protein
MAGTKTYAGAVSSAIFQGVVTGAWVTAGALPTGKRRAVRTGITAASVGIAMVQLKLEKKDEPQLLTTPIAVKDVLARDVGESGKRAVPPATVVALVLSTGMAIGGRLLEKRWLARLSENGHAHPHRALGVRMGALTAATTLVSDVLSVVDARRTGQAGTD